VRYPSASFIISTILPATSRTAEQPTRRNRGRKRTQQIQQAKERDREKELQPEKELKRVTEMLRGKELQQAKQEVDEVQPKKKRRTTRGCGRRTAEVVERMLDKIEEAEQYGDYSDDLSRASDGSSDLEYEEEPSVRVAPSKKRKASDVLRPTAKRRAREISPSREDPEP
jgi:hypothetical protein